MSNQVPFTQAMYDAQQRSAAHDTARRAARAAESTDEHIQRLVDAMETQLDLAKASQISSESAQKFSRWISISSLIVAVASLGAAIAAIVVTVQ